MLFKYEKRRNNVKGFTDSSLGFNTFINNLHAIEYVFPLLNVNDSKFGDDNGAFSSLLLLLLIASQNGYDFMQNATHKNYQKRETEHVLALCHIRGG